MPFTFEVFGFVSKPIDVVYEAVADPAILSKYFTTGGAKGRMETGVTVMWEFADFPGAFPVPIIEATPSERIIFEWEASDTEDGPYNTRVTFNFTATDDGRTKVTITEQGWKDTDAGQKSSYGNCMGWSQMLCAMKAWLEHGINLRQGFYK